jgi:hypothetical protein
MPPTGISLAELGRTARSALTATGGINSAGKSFRMSAPASSAVNASVGVKDAGSDGEADPLRSADDLEVQVGRDNEFAAAVGNASHIGIVQNRAGPDENHIAETLHDPFDALDWAGRVERHLNRSEAGLHQQGSDIRSFPRLNST